MTPPTTKPPQGTIASAGRSDADPFAPIARIEEHLARFLACARRNQPERLFEATRYAALGPGKRLRPLLAWHACEAVGGKGEESIAAGLAVELIHAFSLVHDDLPALDNDDLRRGRPTLHKHAGEAMAILAGDQLMVEAFDCIANAEGLAADTRLALTQELTRATARMVSGQVYDTLGGVPAGLAPLESLVLIHSNKTGALIRAACRMGAMCHVGVSPAAQAKLEAVTAYGKAIGLMFQIVDDLLDVTQSSEHTGKRTHKDADAGKLTYPGVLGAEGSWTEVERLRNAALSALQPLLPEARSLADLVEYLSQRTR